MLNKKLSLSDYIIMYQRYDATGKPANKII